MNLPQMCERPEVSRANGEGSTEEGSILGHAFAHGKTLDTLKARAAIAGFDTRVARNRDGRMTVSFERFGTARVFTHPHDAEAFLAQVRGDK